MNTTAKQPMRIAAFLAGASKCGTTTISDWLFQHPQITPLRESPEVQARLAQGESEQPCSSGLLKEPNIFLRLAANACVDWHQGTVRVKKANGQLKGPRHFDVQLAGCLPDTAQGRPDNRQTIAIDCSPAYFEFQGVAEAIHRLYPEARILISLRHPTERMYSRHLLQLRLHQLKEAKVDCRLSQWLIRRQTKKVRHYWSDYLRHWLSVFDRRQVKILILEEWCKQQQKTARECYRFVGVDDSFKPRARHLNPAEEAHYPGNRLGERYYQLVKRLGKMKSAHSERFSLYKLAIKAAAVTRLYVQCPHRSAAIRQKMDYHFRHEVEAVEHILGRKIPSWHRNRR